MIKNNIFINAICRPWNIHTGTFLSLSLRVLDEVNLDNAVILSDWRAKFASFIPQRQEMKIDENGIAHISVHGVLFNKEAPYFVAGYGGTDYSEILTDLEMATKNAKGILLHIDSPGGHASGNDKVAKAISQCKKPVFAYTDGMCCSAGYAIASGASYIGASSDATVGSIGTILPLMDVSGLWESMGIKPDYITNKEGDLKTAGYPPSQSEEEKASLQAETQEYFELFKSHVLKNRKLKSETMRGQAFVGKSALENNLVDEITSLESVYKKLKNLTK